MLGVISVAMNTACGFGGVYLAAPLERKLKSSAAFRRGQRVASGLGMIWFGRVRRVCGYEIGFKTDRVSGRLHASWRLIVLTHAEAYATWVEGLDYGVDEERVVELGGVAGDFSFYGQEAGGERLFPFDGERGDVGENETELSGGDVAGKRMVSRPVPQTRSTRAGLRG